MSPSRSPEPVASTVALCIPAYNAAWCLPRLLASAAAQTVPFDEILVYDDCSSDDTAAVAEGFGVRVIRGDVNVGCSAGKNRLADATSCTWIHFHDADDVLLPNFVEVARGWMEAASPPDAVLLHYEYREYGTEAVIDVQEYDVVMLRRDPLEFVLRHKVVNFGLYRREAFLRAGGFDLDPDVLFNEDAAFHHRLALAGLRFDFEPTLTCVNYRYGASMSASNRQRCSRAEYHVLRRAAERFPVRHHAAIVQRLWRLAGVTGSLLDWDTTDAAVRLAVRLGGRFPKDGGSAAFRAAAAIAPRTALRLRERMIRRLRPQLRAR